MGLVCFVFRIIVLFSNFSSFPIARLTGTPGICAVTAGPGVTNTITALKNAQMAESPIVLLGGATGK